MVRGVITGGGPKEISRKKVEGGRGYSIPVERISKPEAWGNEKRKGA